MSSETQEPVQDRHESDPEDEGYMLVLRFKERPLIWIAIAVLAVFVVVEGLAILTLRSGSSSQFPEPGDFHDPSEFGQGGSQGGSAQGGGGSSAAGQQVDEASKSVPSHTAKGNESGIASMEIVTGDEAVTRVEAYLATAGLSEADGAELLKVITDMNAALGTLEASLTKGDVAVEDYTASARQEQENARLGILRILGWQKSSILLETLSVAPSGGAPAKG
jgi:hypothetical protein